MYQGFNYVDTLSIEAIQEVQIIKGVIQAEYGQTLGGNVNLMTRGGTNNWHASLFENFQAEDLNARNQFLRTKPPLTFNQFGSGLGVSAVNQGRPAYQGRFSPNAQRRDSWSTT